ncbi:amidase domain-containing protein [Streptomyces sp. H27-G5]|uniref:amidase domain-containing protein n=1 Tax=Streptomyces sp. H27-G5 TaxID=2996698 RepID=UPI003B637CED
MVATWSPPTDFGAAVDPTYVVKVENADGVVLTQKETATPRATFPGLDKSKPYRVSVTAKNFAGLGPSVRSTMVQGSAVQGAAASTYRAYVEEYLGARNKVVTGQSQLAADAIAESPHGQVFGDILNAQGPALINTREAEIGGGKSHLSASSTLNDIQIGQGATPDQVFVRTAVKQRVTTQVGGAAEQILEDVADVRFIFTTSQGGNRLSVEANDTDASVSLSPTLAAENQVEVASAETLSTSVPDAPTGDVRGGITASSAKLVSATGVSDAPLASASKPANNAGTAQWASQNVGITWDYKYDCANFVSKALYNGGGMKMKAGFYFQDKAWYRYTALWLRNSHTWSAAENLRRHLTNHRQVQVWGGSDRNLLPQVGDLIFFKWVGEPVYNHAAVFVSVPSPTSEQFDDPKAYIVAQHGRKNVTSLWDIHIQYDEVLKEPIEKVVVIRPMGR